MCALRGGGGGRRGERARGREGREAPEAREPLSCWLRQEPKQTSTPTHATQTDTQHTWTCQQHRVAGVSARLMRRSPAAMRVHFGVGGHVIVHHVPYERYIKPARGDIGCN